MSAAIFGNVSSIMLRLYRGTEEYHEMLTSIREFIKFHFIPKPLATRLVESYQHSRSFTRGVDMNSVSQTPITTTIKLASCKLQHLQPITACRPIDGKSPLTERAPDDRHHGRGAAHFLVTFNFYCSCLLRVVTYGLQVLRLVN